MMRLADEQMRPSQLEAFADQQGKGSVNHWLADIFNQSVPSTLLRGTGQSASFTAPMPGVLARLNKRFVVLMEWPFENSHLTVRL